MEHQCVLPSEAESLIDVSIYTRRSDLSDLFLLHIRLLRWMGHNPFHPPYISVYGHDQFLFLCFANQIMAAVVFLLVCNFFLLSEICSLQLHGSSRLKDLHLLTGLRVEKGFICDMYHNGL